MATVVGIGHLFWIVPIYFMRSNFASVFGSQADPIFQYFSGLSGSLKNLIYITDDIDPSKRSLYAALALLLFGVAAIGVLVKKNKERIGLLASFIVLYALSFGASSPFWKITSHIPGSFLLRTPQRVFILMLALFLALILGVIEDNLHNIRGKACLAFLLLFIATNAYYHLGNYAPFTLKNEIPSTYNKVAKILESKPSNDYRTIVFPRMGSFVKYSWAKNPRVSISLIDLYTNAKITRWWMNEESVPEIIKPLFDNAFYAKTSNNPNAVLAFFGYKYILFQKDITIVDGSKYQPTQQNVTEKVKHTVAFNDTNVTILENQYPIRPSVYAATESVKAVNDNDALRQIENDQSLQKSLGIVAPETITGKLTGAVTEYRKANPSRYTVTLKGLTDRGLLILQEQFHPGWEAYSQDRTKSVASVRHLQVNSFENGWLIDTTTLCKEVSCNINKDGTKSVTLSLEYTPQRYFDALEILTLLEIFLVTLYIGILSRRPQNDKD
ncbi:MAG: hypothetical protein Q8912_05095 [Bacillota bacterium]|nr:hypothetical protein [Bacillota bacterium]